jgi:hypothetical protein
MEFGRKEMARVSGIAVFILLLLLSTQTQSFSVGSSRSKDRLELMSGDSAVQLHQSVQTTRFPGKDFNGFPRSEPDTSLQLLSQVTQSARERDYIIPPPDVPSIQVQAPLSDGDIVSYTAFDGTVYSLHQFNRKYTAILLKQGDLDLFTIERVRDLVDRVDILYAHLKEFLPLEPTGPGLVRIAFVQTCGGGCGYIGAKGIEIDPQFLNPNSWGPEGVYGGSGPYVYIIHEMTHNFDRYSSYIMYGSDPPHSWTDFLNFYIGVYDSFGTASLSPEALLQSKIERYFTPYLLYPGSTWETCIRDNLCDPGGNMQGHAQGGMVLRIAQLHGPRAARQSMTYLQNAITTRGLNPSTMTILEKNDLLIESLSYGAEANLPCYLDAWRWPVSPTLRAQLTTAFGVNPNCQDLDNDGYSPIRGDCDDANPAIHPGAIEVLNNIDDDCDGIVDDLLFTESSDYPDSWPSAFSLPVPAQVQGAISSSSDSDNFRINLNTSALISFTLKSLGSFKGWFFLLNQGTGDWRTYFYVDAGASGSLNITLEPGQWNFYVAYNTASVTGAYELITRYGQAWPLPFDVPRAIEDQPNHYILVAPVIPSYLSSYSNVMARFWVSGIGWVGSVAASPTMQTPFGWTAPAGINVPTLTYRVQFLTADLPVTDVSSPAGFTSPISTAGLYDPATSVFFLRNSNSSAPADLVFSYGPAGAGWMPVVGDWNGDGVDTIGLYNPSSSFFFLRNSNSSAPADLVFSYGPAGAGWIPIAGDWNGDGTDTIGLYNPATSAFFLRNSNTSGPADLVFGYGPSGAGWIPIAGDWNGDGTDTIGLYNPATSTFFLSNSNSSAPANLVFSYGPAGAGWKPLARDWNGDGTDTIGLYNPTTSVFFLRNTNSSAPADLVFSYGPAGAGWAPIAGDWDGL